LYRCHCHKSGQNEHVLEAAIKNFQFHSRDPEFWHLMQYPASQSAF